MRHALVKWDLDVVDLDTLNASKLVDHGFDVYEMWPSYRPALPVPHYSPSSSALHGNNDIFWFFDGPEPRKVLRLRVKSRCLDLKRLNKAFGS